MKKTTLPTILGVLIKHYRVNTTHMTRKDIAKSIDTTPSTIRKIEMGTKKGGPNIEMIFNISMVLGVKVSILMHTLESYLMKFEMSPNWEVVDDIDTNDDLTTFSRNYDTYVKDLLKKYERAPMTFICRLLDDALDN